VVGDTSLSKGGKGREGKRWEGEGNGERGRGGETYKERRSLKWWEILLYQKEVKEGRGRGEGTAERWKKERGKAGERDKERRKLKWWEIPL
jgi:hypothetical protein